MPILSIDSIRYGTESRTVYVQAVVSDAVCSFAGSYFDPPEYDSALCQASFTADEDTPDPITPDFLELLDLDWSPVVL
jgi:hypothetical protein